METIKIICLFALLVVSLRSERAPKCGLGANDDAFLLAIHTSLDFFGLSLSSFQLTVSSATGFGGNGSHVNWMYDWYSTTTNKQDFTEYVPMLWGINPALTGMWNGNASAWIASVSGNHLPFKEPENTGNSNISPKAAAGAYRQYMESFAGKARLGAPGVSNDGGDWMSPSPVGDLSTIL